MYELEPDFYPLLPSAYRGGKPSHDDDFAAGFAAGAKAFARNADTHRGHGETAYRRVSKKHGSWWVAGYAAAIGFHRDGIPNKIATALGLVPQKNPKARRRRNPDDDVLFPYADRFSSATFPSLATPDYSVMQVAARGSTARAPSQVDGNLVFDAFFDNGDIFGDFLTNPRRAAARSPSPRRRRNPDPDPTPMQRWSKKGVTVGLFADFSGVLTVATKTGDEDYLPVFRTKSYPAAVKYAEQYMSEVKTNPRSAKKPAAKKAAASRATNKATGEVMHEDGAYEIITARGKTFSLAELQHVVGGYIELVPIRGGRFMVVNEEGMMRDMDINPGASLLAGTAIFGPAVVLARGALE